MAGRFSVIRQKMPTLLLSWLETIWPDWEERLFRHQCLFNGWRRKTMGMAFRLTLLVAAVWLLVVVLLSYANGFWEVYLCTPMGQTFGSFSRQTAAMVTRILSLDFSDLAFSLTFISLKCLLIVGAVMKFVAVKRFFYDGQGLFAKLAWLAGCCFLMARKVSLLYEVDLAVAQLLCIVPLAALFTTTFAFASQVVPEFNLVGIVQYLFQLRAGVQRRNGPSL